MIATACEANKCNACDKCFANKDDLITDHNLSSKQNSKYQCNLCNELFKKIESLESHMRIHLDARPYHCLHCSNYYYLIDKLINHSTSKHLSNEPLFSCKFCDKKWKNSEEFIAHDSTHFNSSSYDCIVCGQTFVNDDLLRLHGQTHNTEQSYPCDNCDKRFSRIKDLNIHQRVHKNLPVVTCKFCGRLFVTASNLCEHIQRTHHGLFTDEDLIYAEMNEQNPSSNTITCTSLNPEQLPKLIQQNFKCSFCGMCFVRSNTCLLHCRRNHRMQNVSINDIDAMKIKDAENENYAKIIYAEAKCEKCQTLFDSRSQLINHFRAEHDGDRPFKCVACGLLFAFGKTLAAHIETHTIKRLKCNYCESVFVHQISLDNHLKRHTGNNLLTCDVCGIPYSDLKSLKVSWCCKESTTKEFFILFHFFLITETSTKSLEW